MAEIIAMLMALFVPPRYVLVLGVLTVATVMLSIFALRPVLLVVLMIVSYGLGRFGQIPGLPDGFSLSQLLFLILSSIFVFRLLLSNRVRIRFSPIFSPLLLFVCVTGISILYSSNYVSGYLNYARILGLMSYTIVLYNVIRTPRDLKTIVTVLIAAGTLTAGYTVYQVYHQQTGIAMNWVKSETGGSFSIRGVGTFEDPNLMAIFLVIVIIFLMTSILFGRMSSFWKMLLVVPGLVLFTGLIASFSRSGWLSLAFGGMLLLSFRECRKYIIPSILIASASLLAFFHFFPMETLVLSRISSITEVGGDLSNYGRVLLAFSGIHMFSQNPLLGVGFRAFPGEYLAYAYPFVPRDVYFLRESHTLPITILAETGLLGMIPAVVFVHRILRFAWKRWETFEDEHLRWIFIASLVSFVVLLFDFLIYSKLTNDFFWMFIAFIPLIPRIDRHRSLARRA